MERNLNKNSNIWKYLQYFEDIYKWIRDIFKWFEYLQMNKWYFQIVFYKPTFKKWIEDIFKWINNIFNT